MPMKKQEKIEKRDRYWTICQEKNAQRKIDKLASRLNRARALPVLHLPLPTFVPVKDPEVYKNRKWVMGKAKELFLANHKIIGSNTLVVWENQHPTTHNVYCKVVRKGKFPQWVEPMKEAA